MAALRVANIIPKNQIENSSGCNHLFIGESQPEIKDYFAGGLFFDSCLRRSDAGDGHAEGRAADVVHAEFGAELD